MDYERISHVPIKCPYERQVWIEEEALTRIKYGWVGDTMK